MQSLLIRQWKAPALTFGAMLVLGIAGCGGSSEGPDSATVTLPEPVAVASGDAGSTKVEGGAAAKPESTSPAADTGKSPAAEAAVKAEGWGTLKGKVTFAGDAPKPAVLVAKGDTKVKDGDFCSLKEIDSEKLLVDPETKGVRYAIVYIPRPTAVNPEAESAAKAAPVDFDQVGCVFVPHVLAMMQGTKVNIKSTDPKGHNVNFKLENLKDNFSILPGQAPVSKDVKIGENRPGYVVCDIHPWMKAWWLVLKNPYFAVTDAKGNYEIKNVPAGTQKVVVWQEAVAPAFVTASSGDPVNIKPSGETTKDFTIDAAKVKLD